MILEKNWIRIIRRKKCYYVEMHRLWYIWTSSAVFLPRPSLTLWLFVLLDDFNFGTFVRVDLSGSIVENGSAFAKHRLRVVVNFTFHA